MRSIAATGCPKDLVGDYLHGEVVAPHRPSPAARQDRRAHAAEERVSAAPSSSARSIRCSGPSTSPLAPDGVLYIADMYRGMIEGAPWAMKGTYLRQKIEQYQLDKVLGHGRVWRLTYDGIARDRTQPRMLNETPAQLVDPPDASERMVARHGAAVARAEAGPFGRSGARTDGTNARQSAGSVPRALDARGPGGARRRADARGAEGCGAAHADPGDSRERVALQGRRQIVRRRLARARRRTRTPMSSSRRC